MYETGNYKHTYIHTFYFAFSDKGVEMLVRNIDLAQTRAGIGFADTPHFLGSG